MTILSKFSFTPGQAQLPKQFKFCQGRFDFLELDSSQSEIFHLFLKDLSIWGYAKSRISIFEEPLRAMLEFRSKGKSLDPLRSENGGFILKLKQVDPRAKNPSRWTYRFEVQTLEKAEAQCAADFTLALEEAIIGHANTLNLSLNP